MSITNKNIKSILRTGIIGLGAIGVADLVLSQTSGSLSNFFSGYSIIALPVAVVSVYTYLGHPIFHFDAESEVLHIRSHFAFGNTFGKELYIAKRNIISFEIDRQRIRKKLTVNYIKDGKEFSEWFSISLLSNKKIEDLARQVELIHTEIGRKSKAHLFI